MSLLNIEELSLMAFSSEDVVAEWRESVLERERAVEQTLSVTVYSESYGYSYHVNRAHADTYDQGTGYTERAHTDSYDRRGDRYYEVAHTDDYDQRGNRHTDVAHTDTYDQRGGRHSNRAHVDSYDRTSAHSNSVRTDYVNTHRDRYSNQRGNDSGRNARYVNMYTNTGYKRAAHSKVVRTPHTDSHDNDAHRDYYGRGAGYTKVAHRDSYAKGAGYTQVAHRDSYAKGAGYSKAAHKDTYDQGAGYSQSPGYNYYIDVEGYSKGFDHENYIPTAPDLYNIDGQVISGELEVRLASYDKNKDGVGSQDKDSLDIYYIVKIRQIQDLEGNTIEGEWKTLQNGSMTEEFNVSLGDYEEGIYEMSTQAYNLPRTENGVTKEYVSNANAT